MLSTKAILTSVAITGLFVTSGYVNASDWIPIYSPEPDAQKGESLFGYSAQGRETFEVKTKDGKTMTVVDVGGYGYVSDMILGRTQTLKQSGYRADMPTLQVSMSDQMVAQGAVRHVNSGYKWPNGVVPYVIDWSLGDQARRDFQYAVEHWNANTSIRLVPRTNQADYIRVQNGGGCSSWIGRSGGAQTLTLANNCGRGAAVHEIGHAVGLFHEQTRTDRDNYIRILWQNISSNMAYNFQKIGSNQGHNHGQYDYDSIMHYRTNAFGVGGRRTIQILDSNVNEYQVGNGQRLSQGDLDAVAYMYGGQDPIEECSVRSIANKEAVTLSSQTGQSQCFKINVPDNVENFEVVTSGNNGDADLYVRKGQRATQNSYDCKSDSEDSNESCSGAVDKGEYYINVYAYQGYNNLQLRASYELGDDDGGPIDDDCEAHELLDGRTVTLKNIAAQTSMCFKVNVTQNVQTLMVNLLGGTGDADIFVRRNAPATKDLFDCASTSQSNDEVCSLNTQAGTYYIRVLANNAVADTALSVQLQTSGDDVETYVGEISTPDEVDIHPNGQWFEYDGGRLVASLTGDNDADLELSLEKWNNNREAWEQVDASTGSTSSESIEYQASYGYYRFKIYSWDSQGTGKYEFKLKK